MVEFTTLGNKTYGDAR